MSLSQLTSATLSSLTTLDLILCGIVVNHTSLCKYGVDQLLYAQFFNLIFQMKGSNGAFKVLVDGYVTSDSGTGIVHSAPAFGEVGFTFYFTLLRFDQSNTYKQALNQYNVLFFQDDYRVCLAAGILTKGCKVPCPVNETGSFTDQVTDFKGLYIKVMNYCKSLWDMTLNHGVP